MTLFKTIEILLCIVTSVCTSLSALVVDEVGNYSSDIYKYSDLVLQAFEIKGQLILTIVTFFELFLHVIIGVVTDTEWLLDNLSLTECILIWGIILLPLMKTINLKPLARLSGLGLFGIITTYVLAVTCIRKQVNITAALFGNLFNNLENHFYTQVHKCGHGVGVIISIFCVHTFIAAFLKSDMQYPKQFDGIIYLVW